MSLSATDTYTEVLCEERLEDFYTVLHFAYVRVSGVRRDEHVFQGPERRVATQWLVLKHVELDAFEKKSVFTRARPRPRRRLGPRSPGSSGHAHYYAMSRVTPGLPPPAAASASTSCPSALISPARSSLVDDVARGTRAGQRTHDSVAYFE